MLRMVDDFPPTQMTIESMIQTAVLVFNEKLEIKSSQYRINPDFAVWNLYMSKKNGRPKQDLPYLDRDNLLSESGAIDMFSLDTKNPDKLWEVSSSRWLAFLKRQEGEDEEEEEAVVEIDDRKHRFTGNRMSGQTSTTTATNASTLISQQQQKNSDLRSSVQKNKKQVRESE